MTYNVFSGTINPAQSINQITPKCVFHQDSPSQISWKSIQMNMLAY